MNKSMIAAALVVASAPVCAEIDPIVIIGDRYESPVESLPQAIHVISKQDIADRGAKTVGEALQSLPQISISDTIGNGNNPAIRMRGYGSSNVLVLIDGAPLNTATTQLPALNTIPLSTVSRIEIMEGSGGVLYGAGAVGGVINIVTTVSDESSLSLSAGSHGYGQVVAETAIPFATGVATVLVATTTSDGYRDNTDFDDNKFAIGLQSDTGGYQHRVDVQVTRAEQQYLSGSTADMLAANPRGGLTADTNDNETYRIQYRGTQLDQGNPLSVAAKWLKSSQQGTVSGTTQFNQTTESISVSPQLLIESYDMLVGLDAQATDFEFNSPTATYATRVQRSDQHQVSVFARRGVNVSENSHLALGARVTAVADDISKVDEAGGALTASTLRDKQTLTAWEAAIRHSLTENTQLTARVDTHYRIPTLDEQAGYSPFPSSLLKAQTGRSTELGLSTTLGRANLSANIYQTDLRNEIAFQSPANFSRYGNFNIDQTRRAGASATLRMPVSASAEVSANIARVDATITGGDHSGKKVPLVPERSASVELKTVWANEWQTNLSAHYRSQRVLASDFDNVGAVLAPETRIDLSASKRYKAVDLSISVKNLLDETLYDYGVRGFSNLGGTVPSGYFDFYVPALPRTLELSARIRF